MKSPRNKISFSFTFQQAASLVVQMVKESTCNAGDLSLIPGSGRPPGEGKVNPLQYSGLENSMDLGAWQSTRPQRVRYDWATDSPSNSKRHWYYTHTHIQRRSFDEIWDDGPRDPGIKSLLPSRKRCMDIKGWHTLSLELFLHAYNKATFLGFMLQPSNSLVTTESSSRKNSGLDFERPEL